MFRLASTPAREGSARGLSVGVRASGVSSAFTTEYGIWTGRWDEVKKWKDGAVLLGRRNVAETNINIL